MLIGYVDRVSWRGCVDRVVLKELFRIHGCVIGYMGVWVYYRMYACVIGWYSKVCYGMYGCVMGCMGAL